MQDFLSYNFVFDNTNILFLITGIIITIFTILSSWRKIEEKKGIFLLVTFFYVLSFSLVIATRNWFIFMVGWEVATLTTAIMLAWDDKSIAWEYFIIQFIGASFLIVTVIIANTQGYEFIGAVDELWLQLMFIIGVGVKSALIGLHMWIPRVYRKASTTFCAISSGWVSKLGYITLLKIITDGNRLLLYLGIIMIFYGGMKALEEKNYKLILAYSSISQLGFITLAIGSGNIYGYTGAVIHIVAHGLAKSTLFNSAGNWIKEFNSTSILDFSYCAITHKINAVATTLSFLSLVAFPLFLGYNSKHLIKYSLDFFPVFELLLHIGSILTAAYVIKILWIIIFEDFKEHNFEFESKIKIHYPTSYLENFSVFIPAISLIILAFTANYFLKTQFDFNYLSGLINTLIYFSAAYLISFPLLSRLKS